MFKKVFSIKDITLYTVYGNIFIAKTFLMQVTPFGLVGLIGQLKVSGYGSPLESNLTIPTLPMEGLTTTMVKIACQLEHKTTSGMTMTVTNSADIFARKGKPNCIF